MDLKNRLIDFFEKLDKPANVSTIYNELVKENESAVNREELLRLLKNNYHFSEVEPGFFYLAKKITKDVVFFAIPEVQDVEEGRLYIVGGELLFLFQSAFKKETVEVTSNNKSYSISLSIEGSDFFYFSGLENWYKDVDFKSRNDIVLFTIKDYDEPKYSITKLTEFELDELIDNGIKDKICDHVEALLNNNSDLFKKHSNSNVLAGDLLKFLLYQSAFDFTKFPANISFFLSLDERFIVSGNSIYLSNNEKDDLFNSYYIGNDIEMEMEDSDVIKLDKGLSCLFEKGDPKKAQVIIKKLKLKYPDEKLLNKFLYQCAYFLEEGDSTIRYAKEYYEYFPKDPDPYRTISEIYFGKGDWSNAEKYIAESMKRLHPEDHFFRSDLYTLWMYIRYEIKDIAGAVKYAKKALEFDPDNEEVLMFLEDLGYDFGNIDDLKIINNERASSKVINVDFKKKNRINKDNN